MTVSSPSGGAAPASAGAGSSAQATASPSALRQQTLRVVVSFVSGLLFALGLGISGMVRPEKVIGFLDVTGNWDPALIGVMVGGILSYALIHALYKGKTRPLFEEDWRHIPRIGRDLPVNAVIGNVLFGAGWALAGYCPGPAIVSLSSGQQSVLIFVAAMLSGLLVYEVWERRRARA